MPRIARGAWTHTFALHPGTLAFRQSGPSRLPFPLPASALRYDLDAIATRLRDTAHAWVPGLFPNGRRQGHEWRLANIQGAPPRQSGSCVIMLAEDHAGDWHDFDGAQGEGDRRGIPRRQGRERWVVFRPCAHRPAPGDPDQAADANLIAETSGQWTSEHRGRGRAYVAVRLKPTAEAFPAGPPNIAAIVEGADTILDPRTGMVGWSDNPALLLAWYLTAPFGWRASWSDIDIPALMAAANTCDELVGTRAGIYERRYTANGVLSLAEGKIAITRKLAAAMMTCAECG